MKIMELFLGGSEKISTNSTEFLSTLLAKETALYLKTRKSHWSVSIDKFNEFHQIFKSQYEQLDEAIDGIAGRIAKAGQRTSSTMMEFSNYSFISENDGDYSSSEEMLSDLFKDHEAIIDQLHQSISFSLEIDNDSDITNFLKELLVQQEKSAWQLKRLLILSSINRKCQSV